MESNFPELFTEVAYSFARIFRILETIKIEGFKSQRQTRTDAEWHFAVTFVTKSAQPYDLVIPYCI